MGAARRREESGAMSSVRFIGRARELECVQELIASGAPLITITGPPGVGKTALLGRALRAAELEHVSVDLALVDELDEALARIEAILPRGQSGGDEEPVEWVQQRLESSGVSWLVLDHVEHLLPRLTDCIVRWSESGRVRVIVTSRERLGLMNEALLELGPLRVPSKEEPPELAARAEAVRLFVQRVRALEPMYEPSDEELEQIVRLVTLLDGLPLAIELAAARTRMLDLPEISRRLEQHVSVLGAIRGRRRVSLDDELDASWRMSSEPEQRALAALALFTGRFDARAAEALITPLIGDELDALDVLQSLRDRSLLAQDRETRQLHLYKVIQRFGTRQLDANQWRGAAVDALVAYHGAAAQRLTERMERVGDQQTLRELEVMQPGMQGALEHLCADEQRANLDDGLWLVRALAHQSEHQGLLTRRRALLDVGVPFARRALDAAEPHTRELAALALLQCCRLLSRLSDYAEIERICELLERARWSPLVEAWRLAMRSRCYGEERDWEAALDASARAAELFAELGHRLFFTLESVNRGSIAYWRREYDVARRLFDESAAELERLGADCFDSIPLCNLVLICAVQNDQHNAAVYGERAIARFRQLGDLCGEGATWNCLGMLSYGRAAQEHARECFERAVILQERSGNLQQAAYTHANLSTLAAAHRDEVLAEHHMKTAERYTRGRDRALIMINNAGVRAELREAGQDWAGMIRALDQALEREDIELFPEYRVHWMARRGVALVMSDRVDEARELFERCVELSRELPDTLRIDAALLLRLHLTIDEPEAWQRARGVLAPALRGCLGHVRDDVDSGESRVSMWHLQSVKGLWRRLDRARREQLLAEALDPDAEAICSSADMARIRIPGGAWADVGNRRNVQRLLGLLVEHHGGSPCSEAQILDALWPGEVIQPDAAANRIYNTVTLLRGAGLKPWLHKKARGYVIDPAVSIVLLEEFAELG